MDGLNELSLQGQFLLWLIWLLIIASIVFDIVMLIDAIKNKKLSVTAKALWVIILFGLNPIGALAYYFIASSKRH